MSSKMMKCDICEMCIVSIWMILIKRLILIFILNISPVLKTLIFIYLKNYLRDWTNFAAKTKIKSIDKFVPYLFEK